MFIFPDLNTGNNTYKAVQQRARLPLAQCCKGFASRSTTCLVRHWISDIVNTVAITAVQAQAIKQTQPVEAAAAGTGRERDARFGAERRLFVAEVSAGGAGNR